jgi:uncharacterized membrane protein YraQ (UPF0718 family)/YHS domain-containing protein
VSSVLSTIWDGVQNTFLMAYEVWWALVIGFAISAIVQAWVPRAAVERHLAGEGAKPAMWATGLGAASSSCSYAAIAIAKSLFQKGASLRAALAFQFASTNLVWELGLVLWILLGWRFALAEIVGGLVLVALLWAGTRVFVPHRVEEEARVHAGGAETGHEHHSASSEGASWRERLTSADAWSDVAHNFRGDWLMLWREIAIGFVLAGFLGLIRPSVYDDLFLTGSPAWVRIPENVVVGPLIAIASFVCSVGNVPLAAVLWAGGISFSGALAFIFADLVILPIVAAYRRYYGTGPALRITALLLVTMIGAALVVDALFAIAGIAPSGLRPTRGDVFMGVQLDYKLVLDVLATLIFGALMFLTVRRGAKDPVCGMTVDRKKALHVRDEQGDHWFCSAHCRARYLGEEGHGGAHEHAHAGHEH